MTARHRDLDTYSHRLNRAANIVPDVLRHLDEQRSTVIVLSASSYDMGRGGGSVLVEYAPEDDGVEIEYDENGKRITPKVLRDRVSVTGTERTVLALDRIEHRRRAILDMVATLGKAIDLLDEACRDALGIRGEDPVISDVPQCTRDIELGDGTIQRCGRHVEHYYRPDGSVAFREGGACAMHRKREQREVDAMAGASNV